MTKSNLDLRRANSKLRRGYGRLAMERAGCDQAAWAQRHDPLFRVKGIERHIRLHA